MRPARIWAVALRQLRALRHDPRTLVLMLVAPILAMVIFGFAFGSEPQHVATALVDKDGGPLSQAIIGHLDRDSLQITSVADEAAARQGVEDGSYVAALVFPEGFSAQARTPGSIPAHLFIDTTNQQLAAVVQRSVANATQQAAKAQGGAAPAGIETEYAFPAAKDARFIDYFVPGVMAFAVTLFTTLLTLLAFVAERTTGTLDRQRASPATAAEIVLGYEVAFGLIATVQALLLLGVAVLFYDILVVGPLAVAGLLVVLCAIDAQAIGILVSAGARREGQAVQFLPFIVLPVFLLSGIFIPVQALPGWLQPFSYAIPPTWAIEGLRDVLLRGWGLERVWVHVSVLAGFAVVLTGLAILGLRRSAR